MRLNTLKPAAGSRPTGKRLGRGIGSGLGKTSGKGHKGQHARAGGYHKVGFEGGQLPLQRRVPKVGFNSPIANRSAQVRLDALNKIEGDISVASLKQAGLVPATAQKVKVILAGELTRAVVLGQGVLATRGAKAAIEQAGGNPGKA